jgi:tetratricopeptide (TPR) repeat protein
MRDDRICPKCGQIIPRGTEDCPICRRSLDFYLRRETLLLVSFAVVAILFTFTGFVVTGYHSREKRLAWHWYTQGETDLQRAKPAKALSDFRNALFHQPGDPAYQLRLAQALIAMNRLDEAQTYLSRLWEADPANGPVNLELGLLAMKRRNVPHVITYFHSAIDGVWNGQPAHRRRLRQELCEYLIDHGRRDEALAELTALSAETPDDAALRTQVGDLFLKLNDYALALKEYRQSLRLNPKQPEALFGAGKAALALGNYRAARLDLTRAVAENHSNAEAAGLLHVADHVLQIDPFDRRVPISERRKRTMVAFQRAVARLNECATAKGEYLDISSPQTDLQRAYADAMKMKSQVNMAAFRRNPDLLDSEMNLVFRIERLTASECGAPSRGVNQALLVIAANYGGRE